MTKRKRTAKENGSSSIFSTFPMGLTASDDEVIAKLRAELSQEDEPEVSQRQVIRLALRFAGQINVKDKQFSVIRDETAAVMEERRLKRSREKYKIRSFPVFPKDPCTGATIVCSPAKAHRFNRGIKRELDAGFLI
jgi:hypothetical protein